MHDSLITTLILIGILGVGAQWLAWRIRIPAILLLIAVGLLAGPTWGWIQPSESLGPVLQPMINLGVAVILFDGGLNLRWSEYREAGVEVMRLVTAGLLITWLLVSLGAHYLTGLSPPVAMLFGALAVVTGPTVIAPLLRHARLRRRTASLLKWEGIINDPIGALLAVLVFEYYAVTAASPEFWPALGRLGLAFTSAAAIGAGTAYLMYWAFRSGRVPEFLKSPTMLVLVLAVYGVTNQIQEEAGLLAVTIMGVVFANLKLADIDELRRFTEYLSVLLLSAIFIVLTANLEFDLLSKLDWRSAALIVAIVFLIRPISVYLSTIGTGMDLRERALIGWIAPRGIVATAMAGVFGPRLVGQEYSGAEQLLPLVFALVITTVALHGLSIRWLARRMKLGAGNPHGALIVGATPWSVDLAKVLQELKVPVIVSDASWHHLSKARMSGLRVHHGQVLSEHAEETLELHELSHLLAVTANDAYNALVCGHFAPLFGRTRVYQLAASQGEEEEAESLAPGARGNFAFDESTTYDEFARAFYRGARFRKTELSDDYDYEAYRRDVDHEAVPILRLSAKGQLEFYPLTEREKPQPGDTIVSFVRA